MSEVYDLDVSEVTTTTRGSYDCKVPDKGVVKRRLDITRAKQHPEYLKVLAKRDACIERRSKLWRGGDKGNRRRLNRYMSHDADVRRWKRVLERVFWREADHD